MAWYDRPDELPEVTSPTEAVALDTRTHAAWGNVLTLPQYLQRERVLRASPFSQAGLRAWVLQRDGVLLASCETYACPVQVAAAGRGTAGSEKSPRGVGHGIASVYVDPDQRGHGYASELLRRVHATLKQEGALLCFLWSEIGPTLYGRLGYVVRPLSLRRYAAAPKEESHGAVPPWKFLRPTELPEALAKRQLAGRGLAYSVEISWPQIDWYLRRAAFYSRCLGRPLSPYVAAQAGDALSVFCPDFAAQVLRVLTLYPGARLASAGAVFEPRSPEGENLRNVLHAARTVAGQLGFAQIELWQNPANTGYLRGGVHLQGPEQVKDLPMVAILGPTPPGARGPLRAEDWQDYERGLWL
jgi:GNAT superfamily N-acetyltransferase